MGENIKMTKAHPVLLTGATDYKESILALEEISGFQHVVMNFEFLPTLDFKLD